MLFPVHISEIVASGTLRPLYEISDLSKKRDYKMDGRLAQRAIREALIREEQNQL